jgi:hypothetical protein
MQPGIDHQLDVGAWPPRLERPDDRDCRITGVVNTEDDLDVARIVLVAESF